MKFQDIHLEDELYNQEVEEDEIDDYLDEYAQKKEDIIFKWFQQRWKNVLKENNINAVFHYIPLHSAEAGLKFGRFHGEDKYTTKESERLLRLPLYYGLKEEDVEFTSSKIKEFYVKK